MTDDDWEDQRARLKADSRWGTPDGFWHISKSGFHAWCGHSVSAPSWGFTYGWPQPDDPMLEFYCPECRKYKPVNQLSLFGD